MHVAAVQYDIAWEDKAENHRRLEALLDAAALPQGAFVLIPEMGDTGFSFNLDAIVDDRTQAWGAATARRLGVWLQVGDARRGEDGRGRNRATVFDPDGAPRAAYEKVHPFSFGREAEHFSGGDRLALVACGDAMVCPLICYDLRFPELWRLAVTERDARAELFAIGASWPSARQDHWRTLLIARAIENQAYVVSANRVGADPSLSYVGGSMIIAPSGAVLAEAGTAPAVIQAEIDLEDLRAWRERFPALADIHRDLLGRIRVERSAPRADAT